LKKLNYKKNQLNRLKLRKKPTISVRFRFYKPETKKIEPNPKKKKLSQTGKKMSQNRAKQV
jgi:hypothetical protein